MIDGFAKPKDMHHLYRHFDKDDVLLYVGISLSAVGRLCQHRELSPWFSEIRKITIEDFETREASLIAETAAIQLERPRHNIAKTKLRIVEAQSTYAADASREVIRRVVFQPMYTVKAASEVLGVSPGRVKKLIALGRLGQFDFGNGVKPATMISGWQIIDFLDRPYRASIESGEP